MGNGKGGNEEMVAMVDDTLIRTIHASRTLQPTAHIQCPFTRDHVHVFLTLD